MKSAPVGHVSDTALWVATYRARETERPNPAFRDPLAARLTGERGSKIADAMPFPKIMHWVLVVRTVVIDKLILQAIADGADTVINLGAGLDTRPYRMTLPAELRWIEVDFPHMVEYKTEKLSGEKPVCQLERISADLSRDEERRGLFKRLGAQARKAVIVTEGVIPYLSNEEAATLSRDLHAIPTFHYWIQDYRNGGTKQWAPKKMKKVLKLAPFKFDVKDWTGFFPQQGWKIRTNLIAADEGEKIGRPFPTIFPWTYLAYLYPKKSRERWRNSSGYVTYER